MRYLRTFCANIGIALLAILLAVSPVLADTVPRTQDLEQLRLSVKSYLQDYYQNQFDAVEIDVNRLDPRLRLAHCQGELAYSVRDLTNNGGAVSVKTECLGATPWSIYIGAQINIYQQVVVTNKTLNRGDIVQRADLSLQKMNSSALRNGYFTAFAEALGKEVRRNLEAGEIMRDGLLSVPLAINRGDIITVTSSNGAINVNTRAEALSHGRVGEQIRVRNLTSERIIVANVVEPGLVEVKY